MPGKTLLTEEQETQNLARAARAYVALEAYRNFKKEGPRRTPLPRSAFRHDALRRCQRFFIRR